MSFLKNVQPPPQLGLNPKAWIEQTQQFRRYYFDDSFFDPFYAANAQEEQTLAMARRQELRYFYRKFSSRIWRAFVICLIGGLFLSAFGSFVLHVVRWLIHPPGSGHFQALIFSLLYLLVLLAIALRALLRNARISGAMRVLQVRLGGSIPLNPYEGMLDWMDEHWPSEMPMDEIGGPMPGRDRRWDLCTSYEGHALLVHVYQRIGVELIAAIDRVSLYLSVPNARAPGAGEHDAVMQELQNLGFKAKLCSAGIYLRHEKISPESLDAGRIAKVLSLALQMTQERGNE